MEDNFYQKFDGGKSKSNKLYFNFFIPFLSGILGAGLIICLTLGIPNVRNKILNIDTNKIENSSGITQVSTNATQVSLKNFSDTSIFAANKVLPSIVSISVKYNVTTFGMTQTAEATGSGVVITKDGYILTNNHIVSTSGSSFYEVSSATSITVSLYNNDKQYEATIIGTDAQTDLAIIKIDATDLTAAELGNSDNVKVGEFVLAVGNPLGLETSVTSGIVSALDRSITSSDGNIYVVMQTDCAINAGNSGGALVNSEGQVIGINTLKLSGTGIEGVGFAIPINDTVDVYKDLISYGKVLRPYIGINGRDLAENVASKYNFPAGIYVEEVVEGSPASIAGLKKADVIVKIDSVEIKTMKELNEIKNKKKIGEEITLTVYRNGENQDFKITLAETP